MCLDNVIKGKERQVILDKLPEEIIGYKLVEREGKCNYRLGIQSWIQIFKGLNKFRCNWISYGYCNRYYRGGSHIFLKRPTRNSNWYPDKYMKEKLMTVKFKKQDIKTVGYQSGLLVVTISQFIAPDYCGAKNDNNN